MSSGTEDAPGAFSPENAQGERDGGRRPTDVR
ncbi:hypothetical protein FHR80_002497 [Cellulomonas cellasea]|uniref:Uncharacterized protein n=1 Tax=Cellulomonas cellasea TaxID=43670 RepID=A0A7W4YCC8_9CELL|nr:hypothetical protein [Cellulomonas cellasea]